MLTWIVQVASQVVLAFTIDVKQEEAPYCTLASFLNKKVRRVETLIQTEVETATVSKTVSDSGSDNDDTGIVYQGMPSSDD